MGKAGRRPLEPIFDQNLLKASKKHFNEIHGFQSSLIDFAEILFFEIIISDFDENICIL